MQSQENLETNYLLANLNFWQCEMSYLTFTIKFYKASLIVKAKNDDALNVEDDMQWDPSTSL